MKNISICIALLLAVSQTSTAQKSHDENKMMLQLQRYFAKYKPKNAAKDAVLQQTPKMLNYQLNNTARTLVIYVDGTFAQQEFSQKSTQKIYSNIKDELPKPYRKYQLKVMTNGMAIEQLIPNYQSDDPSLSRAWGDIDYEGNPWIKDVSSPLQITHGLQNRHLSLWASHGRYFDVKRGRWEWQRPNLFGTNEDLFTQTIVVPYLIPMLENAGAIVFTPRERDWQKNEVIVDNDNQGYSTYLEINNGKDWESSPDKGFNWHSAPYIDGENPFTAGTARMAKSTKRKNKYSEISYQPNFQEPGRYAVYVSYQSTDKSIDDAHYTVWHQGEKTNFQVNQQMGGGTWVYLGTFDFDKGSNEYNRVVLTNQSDHRGIVTADAVRFGGGMGNIQRGSSVSMLPRCLEGARYTAQWAGMPYSIYSSKNGEDDYGDDINVRSLMTNYLAGGSCYAPTKDGQKVPIELSLAIHSDAGYDKADGLIGSLAICTTTFNDGRLNAGISRMTSKDLANTLLTSINKDLQSKYGKWATRGVQDKNYSETRMPDMPSCIIETLSHQNFTDMFYALDPNFKFTLARSLYKGILKYTADVHGTSCMVTPLTPDHFSIERTNGSNEVKLRWNKVLDADEETAVPSGYIVYTAAGPGSFDNGMYINTNEMTMQLQSDLLYRFKVVAVNRGGKSFPTEELCALIHPGATATVMIASAFHRLSAPAVINTASEQGFDLNQDAGITYGKTAGWVGRQQEFSRSKIGKEGPGGLGYSGNEMAGYFVAGNDFDHAVTHAEAIQNANKYNILSCSSEAIENGSIDLKRYEVVDLILGLNRNTDYALKYYPTFPTLLQSSLKQYAQAGGKLLISGSYIGSDNMDADHQQFINSLLKCQSGGTYTSVNDTVIGMGTTLTYYNQLNDKHYAATTTDRLLPMTGTNTYGGIDATSETTSTSSKVFTVMRYADNGEAAVAYNGSDYKAFTMGFPFECIRETNKRAAIMSGILSFLLKR